MPRSLKDEFQPLEFVSTLVFGHRISLRKERLVTKLVTLVPIRIGCRGKWGFSIIQLCGLF